MYNHRTDVSRPFLAFAFIWAIYFFFFFEGYYITDSLCESTVNKYAATTEGRRTGGVNNATVGIFLVLCRHCEIHKIASALSFPSRHQCQIHFT